MDGTEDALIRGQIDYYRAYAHHYDRTYDERDDMQRLLAVAEELPIAGDVLELACGTGQWTRLLAARARSVTAVDASEETLGIARARVASLSAAAGRNTRFVQADVFTWQPPRRFDTVFFAFWLSHVPPARFPAFWDSVAAALAPHGTAIFVDDGPAEAAHEEGLVEGPVPTVLRRLDDGSPHRIVKVYHDAGRLAGELAALGWSADVRPVGDSFIAGTAQPPRPSR